MQQEEKPSYELIRSTNQIYVLFYEALRGRWWDKLVAWRTSSRFSHCELLIDTADGEPLDPKSAAGRRVKCVSASPREGCVRVKTFTLDPGKWLVTTVPANDKTIPSLSGFIDATLGDRYDWPGVISLGLSPLPGFNVPRWWFCSEWCCAALQINGFLHHKEPAEVDPGTLYRCLIRMAGARSYRVEV